jgi:hypothetical protein
MRLLNTKYVTQKTDPVVPGTVPAGWKKYVPDYCQLISVSNGFLLLGGIFRVFGLGEGALGRDALVWNEEEWRDGFAVPETYLFLGENVFGDQYAFDTAAKKLLLMTCEGGEFEETPFGTITELVEDIVDNKNIQGIDFDLLRAASEGGLSPNAFEHLGFAVPLIGGGTAEVENLEVVDASAHMQILAQIVPQIRDLPPGTPLKYSGQ